MTWLLLLALVDQRIAITGTNTVFAASCSQANVQTAVDAAPHGWIVSVPAGSCTWSSAVTGTKAITIQGAGVGLTVITSNTRALDFTLDATSIMTEATLRIYGFTFDGNNTAVNMVQVTGAGVSSTKPFKNLIIRDNAFKNSTTTLSGGGCIQTNGQVRGVIYSNTFDRCNFILGSFGNDSTTEWENGYFPVTLGSLDNLYFEDNTIAFSSSFAGSDPGWFEMGQGGRVVVRFNTTDLTNTTQSGALFDSHGFQGWNGSLASGQTGTMLVEYYGNAIVDADSVNTWIAHRGTVGFYFDNTLAGASNPNQLMMQYDTGCGTGDINPDPVAYVPYLNSTYAFHNTRNGTEKLFTIHPDIDACGLAENVHFWQYNAAFDGTVGVGRGVVASRPATCTTGVAYWATDEGEWNSTNGGTADGRLYKCTSTNTWTLHYTPYTYPHPLRAS